MPIATPHLSLKLFLGKPSFDAVRYFDLFLVLWKHRYPVLPILFLNRL
jgi:hypothetical protein